MTARAISSPFFPDVYKVVPRPQRRPQPQGAFHHQPRVRVPLRQGSRRHDHAVLRAHTTASPAPQAITAVTDTQCLSAGDPKIPLKRQLFMAGEPSGWASCAGATAWRPANANTAPRRNSDPAISQAIDTAMKPATPENSCRPADQDGLDLARAPPTIPTTLMNTALNPRPTTSPPPSASPRSDATDEHRQHGGQDPEDATDNPEDHCSGQLTHDFSFLIARMEPATPNDPRPHNMTGRSTHRPRATSASLLVDDQCVAARSFGPPRQAFVPTLITGRPQHSPGDVSRDTVRLRQLTSRRCHG